jgi:hypothetical protein
MSQSPVIVSGVICGSEANDIAAHTNFKVMNTKRKGKLPVKMRIKLCHVNKSSGVLSAVRVLSQRRAQ